MTEKKQLNKIAKQNINFNYFISFALTNFNLSKKLLQF